MCNARSLLLCSARCPEPPWSSSSSRTMVVPVLPVTMPACEPRSAPSTQPKNAHRAPLTIQAAPTLCPRIDPIRTLFCPRRCVQLALQANRRHRSLGHPLPVRVPWWVLVHVRPCRPTWWVEGCHRHCGPQTARVTC